jgi:hypothetical protein
MANLTQKLTPKLMMTEDKFHGYVGHVAILKDCDYKSAKIIGGEGIKLYMQSIDGTVFECYHDNIESIWDK